MITVQLGQCGNQVLGLMLAVVVGVNQSLRMDSHALRNAAAYAQVQVILLVRSPCSGS